MSLLELLQPGQGCAAVGLTWALVQDEAWHEAFAEGAYHTAGSHSLCPLFSFPMQEGSLWPSESTVSGNGIAEVRGMRARVPRHFPLRGVQHLMPLSLFSLFISLSAANLHSKTQRPPGSAILSAEGPL